MIFHRIARQAAPSLRRALWFLILALAAPLALGAERVALGSKRSTESYVLAEIAAQATRAGGAEATHRPGMGNTAVLLQALATGAIDAYPEYWGTVEQQILKLPAGSPPEAIAAGLAKLGLAWGVPFGFSNSYALAVTQKTAAAHGLRTLGDLRARPALRMALSYEFLGRVDGWPGLAARYRLPQRPVAIDHGISYTALADGRIDVSDIYTTDAQIGALGLVTLADDERYFPRYDAGLLYRADLPRRAPRAWRRIAALQGRIDTARMIAMNADAELRGQPFARIATQFLAADAAGHAASSGAAADGASASAPPASALASAPSPAAAFLARLFGDDLGRLTRQHVLMVAIALLAATAIGIPLGALAAAWPPASGPVMAAAGLMQTVPSLALLAALIPLLGRIGFVPAVIALALYALLPIVRNTATGIGQVPRGLRQAAVALGMRRAQVWRLLELPLAGPVILAGIKTAAVLTVGTATIAAFIGAGGYGERIVQGLALNDGAMLLAGAVPAAVLALVTQGAFALLERLLSRRPH